LPAIVLFTLLRCARMSSCRAAVAIASASLRSFLLVRRLRNGVTMRRDQAWPQAEIQTPPYPMMRAAARFHRHHRAGRHLRQPQHKRLAAQILSTQHMTRRIHFAYRKHALRQIHATRYSAHGHFFC
jgi:hypothetical protein